MVRSFCRRVGIAATIDGLCPVRDVAIATHGQVIEALVANRLTSPSPLLRVEDWARAWAVPEVFGISAEALNDDRLGRALDAIAPQLDAIVGTIGARAISEFGLDVSRLHWDMTSISLQGAYTDVDDDHVRPRYGKPKDRRPDLKQIQTGLAACSRMAHAWGWGRGVAVMTWPPGRPALAQPQRPGWAGARGGAGTVSRASGCTCV